jgi:LacI family transcriptional regulator
MITMRDVARSAGVSISTVSRVLSRKIPVDEQTARKVKQAIKELKYRPNQLAAGLRSKSGKSIGLLVPRIADPFFTALIDHVDRHVVNRGYNLLLFNTHMDPQFEELVIDNLLHRHVDGIIFSMVSDESWAMELVQGIEVPVVMLDRARPSRNILTVVVDNAGGGRLAASHLADLGHRRIACVTGPKAIHLCSERLSGFQEGLSQRGLSLGEESIIEGDFTYDSGIAAASRIVRDCPDVTAVWAQNDMMALGIVRGLKRSGYRVPEDVSVMGMDGLDIAEMLDPPLTTIRQPIEELADRAVSLILDGLPKDPPNLNIVLPPSLVVRESTRPLS